MMCWFTPPPERAMHPMSSRSCPSSTNLFVKGEKCEFHVTNITFLGNILMAKIKAVTEWLTPHSIKKLKRFLGYTNFYRRFIRRFSTIAAPFTVLLKRRLNWKDGWLPGPTLLRPQGIQTHAVHMSFYMGSPGGPAWYLKSIVMLILAPYVHRSMSSESSQLESLCWCLLLSIHGSILLWTLLLISLNHQEMPQPPQTFIWTI